MKHLLACILLLLSLSGQAKAQQVSVLGGEHDGFTRLVLYLPQQMEWQVSRPSQTVVEISLAEPDLQFGLSNAFDRITRDRVQALTQAGPSRLRIDLACPCDLRGFLHRSRLLVLDISDDPLTTPPPSDRTVRWATSPPAEPLSARAQTAPTDQAAPPSDTPPIDLPLIIEGSGTRSARDWLRLGGTLASAMDLITLEDHMSMETANSPTRRPGNTAPKPTAPSALPCPDNGATLTRQWHDATDFVEGTAPRRAALYTMTGQRRADAALDLAQFYLSHGAGLEALALLAELDRPSARLPIAMATLLDRPIDTAPDLFSNCPALQIWEVLAHARHSLPPAPTLDDQALIAGFRGLSPPLQALFQKEVLDYLTQHGVAAAEDIRAYVFRTRGLGPKPGQRIITGAPAQEVADLVARFDSFESAARAESSEANLIESFLYEYQDTSLEPGLWAAHIRSLTARKAYPQALDQLITRMEDFRPVSDKLYADVLRHLTAEGDDITFLRIALSIGAGQDGLPIPRENVAGDIAARLSGLGF